MHLLLAIDAGGTSTRAVLVLPHGQCVGYGSAGGGNPISSGNDGVFASLRACIGEAFAAVPPGAHQATSAVLAMAGASAITSAPELTALLHSEGVSGAVTIEPDLLATFFSGTYHSQGHVLVAGTGSIAARIDAGRLVGVADGLGWLVGDSGAGFWLGHHVVRAVAEELDGRGPATSMTGELLTLLGIQPGPATTPLGRSAALQALLAAVYSAPPVELARFATVAFSAAAPAATAAAAATSSGEKMPSGTSQRAPDSRSGCQAPDAVALALLERASDALLATLRRVTQPQDRGLPLILGGSVLGALARDERLSLAGYLDQHQKSDAPVDFVPDGVVGAAVLALLRGGHHVDRAVFELIKGSLATLR